jgi:hypothetical protein
MDGQWFDLALAFSLVALAASVGWKGVRERSRHHLVAAGLGLLAAAVLLYLHRDAFWPR